MIEEIINNKLIQLLGIILSMLPLVAGIRTLIKFIRNYINQRRLKSNDKRRKEFYAVLNSMEFQKWRDKALLLIYGKKYFTRVFNVDFPAFPIDFDRYYKYSEFKSLYSKDDLHFEGTPLKRIRHEEIQIPNTINTEIVNNGSSEEVREKKKLIIEYEKILGQSVKCPKLIGFMLDHYDLNKNKITHIYPKLGDYALNLYTSHILEYELLRAYEKNSHKMFKDYNLWDYLPFRRYIHKMDANENDIQGALFTGQRRFSLFSVQCIVMFKDRNKKKYSTILMRRATDPDKVAAKIGFYQFPPAGGFELYEKEHIHTGEIIIENYSLRKAILREYLEEIFGIDDFKTVNPATNQETTSNILNHPEVKDVMLMIERGTAKFELMGIAVDLVSLRHELSFILLINDESYSSVKHFCPNDEFTREQSIASKVRIPITELEQLLDNEHNINQGSAILYHMAKKWCKKNGVDIC